MLHCSNIVLNGFYFVADKSDVLYEVFVCF